MTTEPRTYRESWLYYRHDRKGVRSYLGTVEGTCSQIAHWYAGARINYKTNTITCFAPREYKGFTLTRDGGPDAPWRAWREDGTKLRADTLVGLKSLVTSTIKES